MADWPQIFFARHGETSWNKDLRYQGQKDIPLNETGQRQGDAIGPLLVDMLNTNNVDPTEVDWFVSPLCRAVETMERMRVAFDTDLPKVHVEDLLMEISFGIMEGKRHSELEINSPIPVGDRPKSYWDFRPPEGENYSDVVDRLALFSKKLTRTSVIVAHGGVLRAVRHMIEKMPREEAINWRVPQGAIAHFLDGQMNMHFAQDFDPTN